MEDQNIGKRDQIKVNRAYRTAFSNNQAAINDCKISDQKLTTLKNAGIISGELEFSLLEKDFAARASQLYFHLANTNDVTIYNKFITFCDENEKNAAELIRNTLREQLNASGLSHCYPSLLTETRNSSGILTGSNSTPQKQTNRLAAGGGQIPYECGPINTNTVVRILSIDGGGIRGILPIKILEALSTMTKKEPYQLFDVICGTSTGGILALLLGVLKINVKQLLPFYESLGNQIFPSDRQNKCHKICSIMCNKEIFSHIVLERIIKEKITHAGNKDDVSMSAEQVQANLHEDKPYVFVITANKIQIEPYLFRNYGDRCLSEEGKSKNVGTNEVQLWQAARATGSPPGYFKSILIHGLKYVDGGIVCNNPTLKALDEIERINELKGRQKKIIISLGTGLEPLKMYKGYFGGRFAPIAKSATNTSAAHDEVKKLQNAKPEEYYYKRLNPVVGPIELDDTTKITVLKEIAEKFIDDERTVLQEIKEILISCQFPQNHS